MWFINSISRVGDHLQITRDALMFEACLFSNHLMGTLGALSGLEITSRYINIIFLNVYTEFLKFLQSISCKL